MDRIVANVAGVSGARPRLTACCMALPGIPRRAKSITSSRRRSCSCSYVRCRLRVDGAGRSAFAIFKASVHKVPRSPDAHRAIRLAKIFSFRDFLAWPPGKTSSTAFASINHSIHARRALWWSGVSDAVLSWIQASGREKATTLAVQLLNSRSTAGNTATLMNSLVSILAEKI